MKQAIIIMTLMGCDHDERNCVYIDTVSQSYRTETACMTASEQKILAKAHAPYPVILAQCSAQTAERAQVDVPAPPSLRMAQSATSIGTPAISTEDNVPTTRSTMMLKRFKQFGVSARVAIWQTALGTARFVNPF